MSPRRVCVIGAGIIGVSTALNVLETIPNVTVTIITENITPNTTSDVSGGLWDPHLLNKTPIEKLRRWGAETFDYFATIADSKDANVAAVCFVSGYKLSREPLKDLFWTDIVRGYRVLESEELKSFGSEYKYGCHYTSLITDVKTYLPWLMQRYRKLGGIVVRRRVSSFNELKDSYDVIVNCTGIGARDLCADHSVVPVRGQVTKVEALSLKHFILDVNVQDNQPPTYIIPGPRNTVLGGCSNYGNFDLNVNLLEKERMIERCATFYPAVKNAKVVGDYVGLRPTRTEVRLEREDIISGDVVIKVVHNYGHGGAGVGMHWGCAREATSLVQEIIGDRPVASRL